MTAENEKFKAFGSMLADILTKLRDYNRTEFQTERLRSYYLEHPAAAVPSHRLLEEARTVRSLSPSAACVLATTSTELTLKEALLRPLIAGLIHHEALAQHVSALALAHTTFNRFDSLLVQIIREFAGLDMKPDGGQRRQKERDPLWKGIQDDRNARNRVVHEGVAATDAEANHAIATAHEVLDQVLAKVLTRLGLRLDPDGSIAAKLSVEEMLMADRLQAE